METPAQYNLAPLPPPPPAPGLYRDMPADLYHRIQAMSASGLRRMRKSPAHYYGLTLDPARPAEVPTPAMLNGTLVHCCIFEPEEVDKRYIVVPSDAPRRPSSVQRNAKKPSPETLEAIAWWDEFARRAAGATVVEQEQIDAARLQAAAVRALPEVGALLTDGEGETSAFWIDEETGELCKCRPDWVSPAGEGVIILDGKTAFDASPEGFAKTAWNMDYTLQAAWYSDGYTAATGKPVHGFVFGAVENSWPHQAAPYMLDDEVMAWARRENRRLLNLYAECRRTGQWPGYAQTVQPITMPAWAFKEINA
jgi:hypothetical protein